MGRAHACSSFFFFSFFSHAPFAFPCILLNCSFGRTVLIHTCNCLTQSGVECLFTLDFANYRDSVISVQRPEKIQLWLHFAVTPLFMMHIYVDVDALIMNKLYQNGCWNL